MDGGAERIRRVAAFLIIGGRRLARVVIDEGEARRAYIYVDRETDEVSLSTVLCRACISRR